MTDIKTRELFCRETALLPRVGTELSPIHACVDGKGPVCPVQQQQLHQEPHSGTDARLQRVQGESSESWWIRRGAEGGRCRIIRIKAGCVGVAFRSEHALSKFNFQFRDLFCFTNP